MEQEDKREIILRQALQDQHVMTCYAYSVLQDWSLAKDAFQEMLITASIKAESYKEGNLSGWLRVILKRKALDMLKARKSEVHYADEELFSLVDENMNFMFEEKRKEIHEKKRRVLQECMKGLRQDTLQILLGFYKDRISCDKLAETLGKTANSIWLTLSRSRKVLRKCALEKMSVEDDK
jgi:RNA polymerase sigma factor (sigma-70 family)